MDRLLYEKFDRIISEWKGKVCVFGAGRLGAGDVYDLLGMSGIEIDCYIDNNVKPGTMIRGRIPVRSPLYLKDRAGDYYVVACFGHVLRPEIEKQLLQYDVSNYCFVCREDIEAFYEELADAPERIKARYSQIYDDELFLVSQYRKMTGKDFSLKNPHTFNEKLQWIKINYRDPHTIDYVDKYKAKALVAEKIGNEYIIPTIGRWERYEDIEFEALPDRFVLKCTHDSGSVAICSDKKGFDEVQARHIFERALKRNYFWHAREWQYKFVKPAIIAEEYIGDGVEDLMDYKIFCFSGIPRIIQVDYDRFKNHKRNLYTTDWQYIDASIKYPTDKSHVIERPDNLDELLYVAEKLSEGLLHVRVDLYDYKNKIYFGEMTFCHGAGYEHFSSDLLAKEMGDYIKLPTDEWQ